MSTTASEPDELVTVSVPATSAWVGVVRSLVAGVAARLDYDLDRVEDVRLAVTEACAALLDGVPAGRALTVHVHPRTAGLVVRVSAPTPRTPSPDSFAWTVLAALADDAGVEQDGEQVVVRLAFAAPSRDGAEVGGVDRA
jgi:serine/threonine-protein kinase RsbW